MRVLACALVLVASCYDPGVDDCQFRCGANMLCPDGSDCVDGFCRTTSTSECTNDPCTGAPEPPPNCSNKFALDNGGCGVVCPSSVAHDEVDAVCGPSWRAGILDALRELEAAPVTNDRFWVGAQRMVTVGFVWTDGTAVDPSAWDSGFPNVGGSSCAHLDGSRKRLRNDRGCSDDQGYICTYP